MHNNSANFDGGGICIVEGSGPRMHNVIVSGNSADVGGGIYCADSDLRLVDAIVFDNTALSEGGGLQSHFSNLHVDSCTFLNNETQGNYGGAFNYFNDADPAGSGVTYHIDITNSFFIENSSSGRIGGVGIGQANSDSSFIQVTIDKCAFVDNTSDDHYGGLRMFGKQLNFTVGNCFVAGNEAGGAAAGGIFSGNCSGKVSNGLFASNTAATGGGNWNSGGVSVWSGARVDFINCTFADNSAAYGAGLTVGGGGIATTTNCIFWGNSADQLALATWNNMGGTLDVNYCDVQDGIDSVYISPLSMLNWGEGNIDTDPCFEDPSVGDYHLRDSSNCLNLPGARRLG
jgi:hypothetical protein